MPPRRPPDLCSATIIAACQPPEGHVAPNGFLVEHLPTLNLNNAGVILNPVLPKEGTYTPLEEPGHGVKFDMSALSQLQVS